MNRQFAAAFIIFSAFILMIRPWQKTSSEINLRKEKYTPAQLFQQQMAEKRAKIARGIVKADAPDEFARLHVDMRTREGEEAPGYTPNYVIKELERAKKRSARFRTKGVSYVSEWTNRGPSNVPGRTRGLLVHPQDPENTWYAGSVGGGVWKTTDKGQSWTNLTPDLPNLSTTTLAMSAANPDIIYAGTGEGFYAVNFINGSGIFKTSDGGITWNQLLSTANNSDFINVNRIIVDPQNPDILLACTNSGIQQSSRFTAIMRSVDGGQTWDKVFSHGYPAVQQLIYKPGDFNVQYAAFNRNGVLKSTDAGLTWQYASNGLDIRGRVELAIAPTNPNRIFASAEGKTHKAELYVSDDEANSWHLAIQADGSEEVDYLGGQGWYDNTIAVHPFDENKVYFGGVNLWLAQILDDGVTNVTDVEVSLLSFYDLYIDFQEFGGKYYEGRLDTGPVPNDRWVDVTINFGDQYSQKAHRFTVPETAGSNGDDGAGVPDSEYLYQDYVEVPFEVWDTENDRQLMVSFRDQERDGKFDLEHASETDLTLSREYIFIHDLAYAEAPDNTVAQKGGHVNERMYFMWPRLAAGQVWSDSWMPEALISISTTDNQVRLAATEDVSDAYHQYSGENSFPQTFAQIDQTGLHPDHHNLVMVTTGIQEQEFFILGANDGGVYHSKIGKSPGVANGDWVFAGNGYGTSQFYSAEKKRGFDEYIGGMQDNGTWRSPANVDASEATKYLRQVGGDGFEALWHYGDSRKIIASYQYNNFWKTEDGGQSWSDATNGLTDIDNEGVFISNLAGSQTSPDLIYTIGPSGVWKSTDFGDNWSLTSISSDWRDNNQNPDIKVSLADDQVIYAGFGMASGNKIHVSKDGGESFTPTNNYQQSMGRLTGLATHPGDPAKAYALFSFAGAPKILKTTDYGQNWKDITGFEGSSTSSRGFPDVAVHSFLVLPHDTTILWAGTEIGLVESTDNGASWNLLTEGVPATAIWNMKMVDDQVVMATHGRGIWTATIPQTPRVIKPPEIMAGGITFKGAMAVKVQLNEVYDSTILTINQQRIESFPKSDPGTLLITVENVPEGNQEIELIAYENSKAYSSGARQFYAFKPFDPVKYYQSDFDDGVNDFAGIGYTIAQPGGFSNNAIHSLRPYASQSQIIYTLKYPVIVDGVKNKVSFNEIALVEPGEQDAKFGTIPFKDYAIVEASANGYDWQQLGDGYDANSFSEWHLAFTDEQLISESLYKKRNYSLQDSFNAGDTVFVRFRLSSNESLSGWGWAIDDLLIQDPVLGLVGGNENPLQELTIYPNPVISSATIGYWLQKPGMVGYRIIDSNARMVVEKSLGRQVQGNQSFIIDAANLHSGTYYLILYSEQGLKGLHFIKK